MCYLSLRVNFSLQLPVMGAEKKNLAQHQKLPSPAILLKSGYWQVKTTYLSPRFVVPEGRQRKGKEAVY